MARQTINIGDTGSQLISKLANNFNPVTGSVKGFYNVLDYGAVADDSTDNAVVIQALIEIVKVLGGTIYIPAGTYKTSKLTLYSNVGLLGDGQSSILKSINAEPLLEELHTSYTGSYNSIKSITLVGNSIGTIGYNTQLVNNFNLSEVIITGFTTYGVKLHGSLIGSFNNCKFSASPINVFADLDATHSSAPNLVVFNDCELYYASKYSISWTDGSMLILNDCDFEGNGTLGDATTGCVYYRNAGGSANGSSPCLFMNYCWFEQNNGICVFIDESGSAYRSMSVIENSTFWGDVSNAAHAAIKVSGIAIENKVILRSCNFEDLYGLIADGAYAIVINEHSTILRNPAVTNGAIVRQPIDYNGNISPPSTSAPNDAVNPSGYGVIYLAGVAHKIKLYQ